MLQQSRLAVGDHSGGKSAGGWAELLERLNHFAHVADTGPAETPADIQWPVLATALRVARANNAVARRGPSLGEASAEPIDWSAVLAESMIQYNATQPGSTLRIAVLESLVSAGFETDRNDVVLAAAGELTRIRRAAPDWYHLGLARGEQGQALAAGQCLTESMRIDGTYQRAYRSMGRLLQTSQPEMAAQMLDVAEALSLRPPSR